MSIEQMAQAVHAPLLPPARKLLLIGLANYADQDGRCWPSVTTLAHIAGLSRRHTLRHLEALETDGWIERLRRYDDGKQITNVYQLHISARLARGGDAHDTRGGDAHDTGGVTPATPRTVSLTVKEEEISARACEPPAEEPTQTEAGQEGKPLSMVAIAEILRAGAGFHASITYDQAWSRLLRLQPSKEEIEEACRLAAGKKPRSVSYYAAIIEGVRERGEEPGSPQKQPDSSQRRATNTTPRSVSHDGLAEKDYSLRPEDIASNEKGLAILFGDTLTPEQIADMARGTGSHG
ncbi:MAG: helix-turn-helix domain-containing protein [Halomonas sp.]